MGRLEGKVAIVSGSGSGIGRATAAALAREGASVVVADIDDAGAAETCRDVDRAGGRAEAVHLDVTQETDWSRVIDGVRDRHGALHILVNNAALCIRAPILDMDLATWRRQNAVNLDGVFLGCRAAIPLMADCGGGAIVNISSVAGLQGVPSLTGYCASKGGVRLFTKALALECAGAKNNIRVNSIHPGTIETPIWAKMLNGGELPEGTNSVEEIMEQTRASSARITPLGRAGQPSDIAEGVVYLASDAASFVTGAELVIDGGVFAN